jgi:acetyl-CoA carboxylase biotin carboxyl carrier protein
MLPHAAENLDYQLIKREEDIISYCLFPEQALEYFRWRNLPPEERPPSPAELELKARQEELAGEKPGIETREVYRNPATTPILSRDEFHDLNDLLTRAAQLNITELVIRKGESGISLRTDATETKTMPLPVQECYNGASSLPSRESSAPAPENEKDGEEEASGTTINSPLVGKFYTTPAPSKPPYVQVGSTVKAGATVCIVEAMKLINEIKAPENCEILKFLVENGENVDKGQPLILVKNL